MNINQQEKARQNRKEKYKIAREINLDVETAQKIRNWTTTHFIVFCYHKIRGKN